jgi:predicted metal-binding protein
MNEFSQWMKDGPQSPVVKQAIQKFIEERPALPEGVYYADDVPYECDECDLCCGMGCDACSTCRNSK